MKNVKMPKWTVFLGRVAGYAVVGTAIYLIYLSNYGSTTPDPDGRLYLLDLSKKEIYVGGFEYWSFVSLSVFAFISAIAYAILWFSAYFGQKGAGDQ